MWRLSHDRLFQRESKSIQGEVLVLSDYMRRYVIEQEADDCLVHGFQGRNNSNPFREKSSCAVLWPFLLISAQFVPRHQLVCLCNYIVYIFHHIFPTIYATNVDVFHFSLGIRKVSFFHIVLGLVSLMKKKQSFFR